MKVVVVIQARVGSTRLPGKVLRPAAGAPLLQRMVERVCAARTPSEVVVATTDRGEDDAIVAASPVRCLRGHPTDLLDRHWMVARATGADAIVKIPSDCPLIDPATVDAVIGDYLARPLDYVANLHPATWPDGFDVEVMAVAALEAAWRRAVRAIDREHTTPYLWSEPGRFRTRNVSWTTGLDRSLSHRLVLDYLDDYTVISTIFDALWSPARDFSVLDILAFLADRPALRAHNAHHAGTSWMQAHRHELPTLGGPHEP